MNDNDYKRILDAVHVRLLDYGIPPHLSGYGFIAEAVALKIARRNASIPEIYSAVAAKHGKSVGSVIRSVNYAVKRSSGLDKTLRLDAQQIFGSSVISTLAIHIRAAMSKTPPTSGK